MGEQSLYFITTISISNFISRLCNESFFFYTFYLLLFTISIEYMHAAKKNKHIAKYLSLWYVKFITLTLK